MTAPAIVRRGVGYWLSSYRAMMRFEVSNLRSWIVISLVIQLLMSAGMAFMYGFYFGDLPPEAQTFVVTGIPALQLPVSGMPVDHWYLDLSFLRDGRLTKSSIVPEHRLYPRILGSNGPVRPGL